MRVIFVGLPAYNESAGVEPLFRKIMDTELVLAKENTKLIIIFNNDGSTDNTVDLVKRFSQMLNLHVVLLNSPHNLGLGNGLRNIINYFLEHSQPADHLVLMDCDNTHDPGQILKMDKLIRKSDSDIIVASRYITEASVVGVPRSRILTGHLAQFYLGMLFPKCGVTDFTSGYRMYKQSVLKKLKFSEETLFKSNDFASTPELLLALILLDAKVSEVALNLRYDNKETPSKMKVFKNALNIIQVGLAKRLKRR